MAGVNYLHIFDLNDHCLFEVFKYLQSNDLIELYKAHWRFYDAIQLRIKSSKKPITLFCDELREPSNFEDFVRTFGQYIAYLVLEVHGQPANRTEVKRLINQHCSNGNVRKCSFRAFPINESFIGDNINFFKHLKSMFMDSVDMNEATMIKLFNTITAVKDLQIRGSQTECNIDAGLLLSKILSHTLESLTFCVRWEDISEEIFTGLPINTTVKYVKISTQAIKLLEFLPNIESLEIQVLNRVKNHSLNAILTLKKLHTLNVFIPNSGSAAMNVNSLLAMLAKVNVLEKLRLQDMRDIASRTTTFSKLRSICAN